jgi:zinc protease
MLKHFFAKLVALAIVLQAAAVAAQAQSIDLNQPLPFDTTVTKGVLPNGLTYYIKPNALPEQKLELRLVVNAGSVSEDDNQQGLAHFMEHMEFSGLQHFPKDKLIDFLQRIGVQFAADLNAYTMFDQTLYVLPIPTDKAGNVDSAFQIIRDWMTGALITDTDVNNERKVILEESALRMKNPSMRMGNQYLFGMLNNSRYAERPPIGKDSIVANTDPSLIRQFYHTWYRPDLMAVVIVGDITVPKATELIQKYFGDVQSPGTEKARTIYHIAPYTGQNAQIVTDSEATKYMLSLELPARPTAVQKTVGDYKNMLTRYIFEDAVNRKLQALTQTSKPAFAAAGISIESGTIAQLANNDENLQLNMSPVDNFKTSIDSTINILLNIQKYGFTEADVQTAKDRCMANVENAYNERNTTQSAAFVNSLVQNFTLGITVLDRAVEYDYIKKLLPTITVQDVNDMANNWLANAQQNYYALITAPAQGKIPLPSESELISMLNNAFNQKVQRVEDRAAITSLLQNEPVAGSITATQKDTALGTTTFTLSNGVKVTVKPTDFKNDEIVMSGGKYGGTGQFDVQDKSNITFMASVISAMGYGDFTPLQLQNFLAGKQVGANMSFSESANNINGGCVVKDLPVLLELMYLKLTSPRRDTALFNGFITKVKTQIQTLKDNPQYAFEDTLTKVLYDNNPLMPITIPTEQDLNKIDLDRTLQIYRQEFGYADGMHFFFVGNVNIDSLKPLMEKYLGSLPVKGVTPKYRDNGLRFVSGNKILEFRRGMDQRSVILDFYHGKINYSQEADLKANMLAQAMTIELIDTLREKMQAIYSGSVSAVVTEVPYSQYNLVAQMPCSPENVAPILAEYDKEIAGYRKNGVSAINLDKVKKAMLEKYKENMKQNGYWAGQLQNIFMWKHNPDFFLNYDKKINAVTTDDLKAFANQLLNGDNFKAIFYPEKIEKRNAAK